MQLSDYSFNHPDAHPPADKPAKVSPRDQIVNLLDQYPAMLSTGAQPFIQFPTRQGNGFSLPLDSDYVRAFVSARQIDANQPIPSPTQFRDALHVVADKVLAGPAGNIRFPIHNRYAWDPAHTNPTLGTDAKGKPTYDYDSGITSPAYVVCLDTRGGQHVAVTDEGWFIHPSFTPFILDPIKLPIPDPAEPERHADPDAALQPFRQLLRLDQPAHDTAWQTLVDWMLSAMRPPKDASFHDHPILNLMGAGSCGKSVTAKLITQLIDPTLTPLHSLPSTERKLHGLAASHQVLAFDDPGKINPEKSRYLSRLASGIASLHKSLAGMLVRPIILTTKDETETKHLTARVVDVELPPIDHPFTPEEVNQQFEELRPQILGALLTLLARNFDAPVPHLPNRQTKTQKIEESVTNLLEAAGGDWEGTVTVLHQQLNLSCPIKALSAILEEMTTLTVTHPKRKNNHRPLHLSCVTDFSLSSPSDIPQ